MCKITVKWMKPMKLCKVYRVAIFFSFSFFFLLPFLRPPLNFCLLNEDLGNESADSACLKQWALLLLMHLSNLKLIPACTVQWIDLHVDEANPAALKSNLCWSVPCIFVFKVQHTYENCRCCGAICLEGDITGDIWTWFLKQMRSVRGLRKHQ